MEVIVSQAYIVGAVRTPVGRRKGGLSQVHPVDLGAQVLAEVVSRTGIDPAAVEDVIMGCVSQIGPSRSISPVTPGSRPGCRSLSPA